jgi:hypothetical protein
MARVKRVFKIAKKRRWPWINVQGFRKFHGGVGLEADGVGAERSTHGGLMGKR